jgi:hypothetical protein
MGELRRLRRRSGPVDDIERCQRLIDAIDLVMAHQGVDAEYDRDKTKERRPKREYFPLGAYRRDVLAILRQAGQPMRVADILDRLCALHEVELTADQRAHAAIKLAQGTNFLIGKGFVVRASKAGDHRSAACTYALRLSPYDACA